MDNLPSFDDSPASRKKGWCVQNQAHSQAFWVMLTKEPNKILQDLIIHAAQAKITEIKDNAQIVHHFFKTFFAGLFLQNKIRHHIPQILCNSLFL